MKKYSALLVGIAGFCWGLIGVFSKNLLSNGFSPIQITALRCLVAAIGLGIYLVIFDRDKLRIKIRDIYYFIGTGIFSIVFFNVCYFMTVDMVSLSVAAILLYTSPIIIMLLSVPLFKEKLNAKKVFSLILCFAGCILVTGIATDAPVPILGIMTGLGSGLGYALYTIFGRFALKKYHSFTVTFYTFVIATIGIILFSDIPKTAVMLSSSWKSSGTVLLLGVISTLTPFLCYTKGLEGLEAGTASIIACIEPLVATIAGVTIFNDYLTEFKLLGIVLIFCAVIIINITTKSRVNTTKSQYN